MKMLLADEYLLFYGQARNKQIPGWANNSSQPALIGASHG